MFVCCVTIASDLFGVCCGEALPAHPNKHPITPSNTRRTLLLSGRIPFVRVTLSVCVRFWWMRLCARHINYFNAVSDGCLSRSWLGGGGHLWLLHDNSCRRHRIDAVTERCFRRGPSAKMDDSFSISAASVIVGGGEGVDSHTQKNGYLFTIFTMRCCSCHWLVAIVSKPFHPIYSNLVTGGIRKHTFNTHFRVRSIDKLE